MRRPRQGRQGPAGQVRIIGGCWRGTRLPVVAGEGLRPTPDRVRETLFNWLGPRVAGARCLDLFAGSGVLGFEALSRGAAGAVLVERDPGAVERLRQGRERLDAAAEVVHADALAWLAAAAPPFDIIFLDPPYGGGLLAASVKLIHRHGLAAPQGRIYMEDDSPDFTVPGDWSLIRQGNAGQVHFALAAPSA
ncbi:MAG: 16S rRNA (guanine(966)-N(2))-methyltransferase RsmD [Gammaproteobacteria bacterium]|nr:16S rRNA (guanine(966)-N(2))-methyltransferase RsmD [Gammaproteobacteria bacterium]